MENRYAGDQYKQEVPQFLQPTGQSSSSNNDDEQQRLEELKELKRILQQSQDIIQVNEDVLGRQMDAIYDKVQRDKAISKKTHKPSIEDKLVETNIPYLFDNEIVEELEYLSDLAWSKMPAMIVDKIQKKRTRKGSLVFDLSELNDDMKIHIMKIINDDKNGEYGGKRRQKKVPKITKIKFKDKSFEERLRFLETAKTQTEQRILQLQKYSRLIGPSNFTIDFPEESNSSDSEYQSANPVITDTRDLIENARLATFGTLDTRAANDGSSAQGRFFYDQYSYGPRPRQPFRIADHGPVPFDYYDASTGLA